MKKIIASLIVLFAMSVFAFAQENSHIYYVEVYEVSILGIKSVNLDYGEDAPSGMVYKIFDENGNIEFKNVVAAINYLSDQGWELVTVFEKNVKAGARTIYLLKFDSSKHPKNAIVTSIDEYLEKVQK